MEGCRVRYGDKIALGKWTEEMAKLSMVSTGQSEEASAGGLGPNGSGKTTIVSLLCSDHPQTYSLPIKLFGRSQRPEPGFGELPRIIRDIQARVHRPLKLPKSC